MASKRGGKKSGKKSGGVELVVQPHGGAIRKGSAPGNTPGTGMPPSELRRRMRGSLEQRLEIAEEIADDEKQRPSDRLKALEFLARYGLGAAEGIDKDAVRGKVRETLEAIRDTVPEDVQVRLVPLLREIWR